MIRTRFAPSPTGYLHVGNLRTALYAYLVAKQNGGKFLLRIEDTDRERFVADGTLHILRALYWAGIIPDEGVKFGKDEEIIQEGDRGPYIQSERLPMYQKYATELLDKGYAYYCFCTSERLEELREFQQKNKLPPGYDRRCLGIPYEEAKKRVEQGEKHVARLKMPKEGETVFTDLVRGEVRFKNELVDDQVLIKSDGFPTYHLAVVVDDHLMEITHVIRGEEWISSTPKHIQLYTYFGWQPPHFAHLSLFLNPDKSKLSKRQGDVSVNDYREKGYLPEAVVNFMAFLGWNPGTEKELYSMDELVKDFSLDKVSKAGAVFNIEKLNWFNKEYMKRLPLSEVVERARPWLEEAGSVTNSLLEEGEGDVGKRTRTSPMTPFSSRGGSACGGKGGIEWLEKVIELERERVTTLAELPEAVRFVFELPEYQKELLVWRKGTIEEVRQILPVLRVFLVTIENSEWTKEGLEKKVGEWIKEKGYSVGSVLWPLRVALSGQQNSPGPYEIAEVLGKSEVLQRLDVAIKKV